MIDAFPKSKDAIDISFINHQSVLFAYFKRFEIFLSFSWIFNSYSLSFGLFQPFQSKLSLKIIIFSQQPRCFSNSTFPILQFSCLSLSTSFYFSLSWPSPSLKLLPVSHLPSSLIIYFFLPFYPSLSCFFLSTTLITTTDHLLYLPPFSFDDCSVHLLPNEQVRLEP